ncbi:myocardin-like [Crotalus adamanteus]|uniref:Myocardin-like n=1 Tax=Crotalus adamanteus TaxID=8729 RepID=A0AAW1B1I4_CROAD
MGGIGHTGIPHAGQRPPLLPRADLGRAAVARAGAAASASCAARRISQRGWKLRLGARPRRRAGSVQLPGVAASDGGLQVPGPQQGETAGKRPKWPVTGRSRSFLDAPARGGDLPAWPGRGSSQAAQEAPPGPSEEPPSRPSVLSPTAAPVSNMPRSGLASPPCSQAGRSFLPRGTLPSRFFQSRQWASLSVERLPGEGAPQGESGKKGPRSAVTRREAMARRSKGPQPELSGGAGLRCAFRFPTNSAPKARGRKAGASEGPEATGGVVDNCEHQRVLHKVPEARKAPRPKKAKESRPKVKKLKYHQYMPPDQKGEQAPLPMDTAYAHLLQQQQVFLQLQILNQQQQPMPTSPATFCVQHLHAVPASNAPEQLLNFPGTPASTNGPPTLPLPSPATPISPLPPKPELLPANLEELTVSELRQQLRKRGLPVSGTKPALLERLKPYQVARVKPPPAPLPSARLAPSELEEEPQALQEKQRVVENLALKLHRELKHHDSDPREELQVHKQIKNCRKGALQSPGHQEAPPPPYIPKRECAKEGGGMENEFMVLCSPSCEPIHSDMELPLEITASPPDPAPATQSLEEELQEAIQKAQLVPSQSIEEILEEPLMCRGDILQAPALTPEVPDQVSLSPLVHQEASPPKKSCSSNEPPLVSSAIFDFPGSYNFLSTASSSSASLDSLSSVFSPDSLEMPPSPPDAWQGSGTRAGFDPVDWLEALTSGSASGLSSASPVGNSIFCTDLFDSSDLGVNHMIDLMVEQW